MATRRRTEKLIEIHEFYVIRSASGSLPVLCGECAMSNAIMVTPEQAATVARVTVRLIYRWVESRAVHYQEKPDGSLVVCLGSLPTTVNLLEDV